MIDSDRVNDIYFTLCVKYNPIVLKRGERESIFEGGVISSPQQKFPFVDFFIFPIFTRTLNLPLFRIFNTLIES